MPPPALWTAAGQEQTDTVRRPGRTFQPRQSMGGLHCITLRQLVMRCWCSFCWTRVRTWSRRTGMYELLTRRSRIRIGAFTRTSRRCSRPRQRAGPSAWRSPWGTTSGWERGRGWDGSILVCCGWCWSKCQGAGAQPAFICSTLPRTSYVHSKETISCTTLHRSSDLGAYKEGLLPRTLVLFFKRTLLVFSRLDSLIRSSFLCPILRDGRSVSHAPL
jgi:hypothetical protein